MNTTLLQVQGVHADDLLAAMRIMMIEVVRLEQQKHFEEKLLSPAKAIKLFEPNITRGTLYNWEKAGILIPLYLGGKKFYKQSAILDAGSRIKKYSPGKLARAA